MSKSLFDLHTEYVNQATHLPGAYYDIYWLMQHFLGVSWSDVHTKSVMDVDKLAYRQLDEAFVSYKQGMPLAYLLSSVSFLGHSFCIEQGVLIPRPDTESMVLAAGDYLAGKKTVLELGVGSGVIACSLALMQPHLEILGVDKSAMAVSVAQKNVDSLGVADQVTIKAHDWYEPLSISPVDMLISNPPYIDEMDDELSDSVRQYEPQMAWRSAEKGLKDLEWIITLGNKLIKPMGLLVLEHGHRQQNAVAELLVLNHYDVLIRGKDAFDRERFVIAQRQS